MAVKRATAPEFRAQHARAQCSAGIPGSLGRRAFLAGAAGALLTPWSALARSPAAALSDATKAALEQSPFVYVSPLKSDGAESRCHGEVWYGWFEGAVFLTSATTTWKARAVARGLTRARVWVGDYGRWKRVLGRNNAFLEGPHFEATVSVSNDSDHVARLLAELARKYPKEFPSWKDRMEAGHREGSRVLLRYAPVPG